MQSEEIEGGDIGRYWVVLAGIGEPLLRIAWNKDLSCYRKKTQELLCNPDTYVPVPPFGEHLYEPQKSGRSDPFIILEEVIKQLAVRLGSRKKHF